MMYTIDQKKLNFKNTETEEMLVLNPSCNEHKPENPFDLPNKNTYDQNGDVLIIAENPKDYDFSFASILIQIQPRYNCKPFLDYQFKKPIAKAISLPTWNSV